jgi:phosphohistidine swiveling domain-containing protein
MPEQTTTPLYSQQDTNPSDSVRNEAVTQEYVLSLDDQRAKLETVGGKGASLTRLLLADMPVPGGFHVTTAAYERFVADNDLRSSIRAVLEEVDASKPDTLTNASERIGDLFLRADVPEETSEAIFEAYAGLDRVDPAVAVRSSATTEDLPAASFAGQQATSLNVRGEDELLEAVRRCWASLWSARAIAYRERQGFRHDLATIAVVVQRLVPAEVSGILFTANPVSGARDEIVINAAQGLGETVVGGLATPDSFTLDRTTLTILERHVGRQEVETVLAEHGTTERPLEPERAALPILDDAQLARLAQIGVCIEDHFGSPQDIEWAYAAGRFWVLQARPITNLPPAPLEEVRWEPPFPGSAWWRRQVVENMPEPLSPLFDELYLREGLELSIDAMIEFFRMTYFRMEDFVDRPLFTTINGYAYTRANYKPLRWIAVPLFLRLTVDEFRIMFGNKTLAYWREEALPAYLATVERWKAEDMTSVPDELLLAGVRELALADAHYWFACVLMLARAKVTDALLGRFLTLAASDRGLISGMFLRGFPSPALDAEAELAALAERIRGSDELRALVVATPAAGLPEALEGTPAGQAWTDALSRYLDRYGHQVYNLDFVVPTQADNPLPVLLSLKAIVQRSGYDPRVRQRGIVAERDTLADETARSLDPIRRRAFRILLGWAQRFGPEREQSLFHMGAGWPTLRQLALELGQRLVEDGSLLAAEDIFFLEIPEIRATITAREVRQARPELARLAYERRELREARKRLHPPTVVPPGYKVRVGPFDMSAFETQRRNVPEGATLRGFAVSPGQVSAPASVIRSPADFSRMEPGTILVCPTTTPAWTPLFSQASGLVTDIGGVLAHGSIVAREYDIPAVLGTGVATQRIRSGQMIRVDGDAGTVTLLDATGEEGTRRAVAEPLSKTSTTSNARKAAFVALVAGAMVGIAVWWRSWRER